MTLKKKRMVYGTHTHTHEFQSREIETDFDRQSPLTNDTHTQTYCDRVDRVV